MNKKKLLEEITKFPMALDKAVNEKFGEETDCKSVYSFMNDNYIATYNATGKKRKEIELYIDGWMGSHKELTDRLFSILNSKN